MEHKAIVHMDLDSFFVSVSRILNPKLVGKPVFVGGHGDRGVVASCSYEARKFGVRAAMPIVQAKRLCPEAITVGGDYEEYSNFSEHVTSIIEANVPVFEKSSIDEFYMDLTGMDRFFGCYKWATELRQKIIKQTGLPISFGMSTSKMVSKVATGEAKPNGQLKIDPGTEKAFLAPMLVENIPMIGIKTTQVLRSLGIEKVSNFQTADPYLIKRVLGKNGHDLWMKVNGMDRSEIVPYRERKSISTEETFIKDTTDVSFLHAMLAAMTEKLAYGIRKEGKLTTCVSVHIRYFDFEDKRIQGVIKATSCDNHILPRVKELFAKIHQSHIPVRLIGVGLSNLVTGLHQIDLFNDDPKMISLYQSVDRVRKRFGAGKVHTAVVASARMKTFNPFNGIRK